MKKITFTTLHRFMLSAAMAGALFMTSCESKSPADKEAQDRDEASPSSEANPINAESPTPDSTDLVDAQPEQ